MNSIARLFQDPRSSKNPKAWKNVDKLFELFPQICQCVIDTGLKDPREGHKDWRADAVLVELLDALQKHPNLSENERAALRQWIAGIRPQGEIEEKQLLGLSGLPRF